MLLVPCSAVDWPQIFFRVYCFSCFLTQFRNNYGTICLWSSCVAVLPFGFRRFLQLCEVEFCVKICCFFFFGHLSFANQHIVGFCESLFVFVLCAFFYLFLRELISLSGETFLVTTKRQYSLIRILRKITTIPERWKLPTPLQFSDLFPVRRDSGN